MTQTAHDIKFLAMALRIIADKGKSVTFKTYPSATYDPTTGETTLGTVTPYTKKIIPPYPVNVKYINGDTIKSGDMQTGIAGSGLEFVPEPGNTKITIDSVDWSIVGCSPIYSGEQIALYMLILRR